MKVKRLAFTSLVLSLSALAAVAAQGQQHETVAAPLFGASSSVYPRRLEDLQAVHLTADRSRFPNGHPSPTPDIRRTGKGSGDLRRLKR